MSLPREVLPGRTYLITRRCTQRQFLMRPDAETNNAFLYCLAEAALRYGIEVLFTVAMSNHHHTGIQDTEGNYPAFLEHFHKLFAKCQAETNNAFLYCLAEAALRYGIEVLFTVAMSNHHHTGIQDTEGNYPAFLEHFHKLFAKCQNAYHGRWENFWAAEQTSVVRLTSSEDVMEKLIYSITNPVKDLLVEKAIQWPGVNSYEAMVQNRSLRASRPEHFFREGGGMPKEVTLTFKRPEEYKNWSSKAWAELLEIRVREVERRARSVCRSEGRQPLGIKAILRQSWEGRPKSAERRRSLNPRIAAKNKWRRIEALLQNKVFLLAYRAAFEIFREGTRTIFPDGTYWLKRFANVLMNSDVSPMNQLYG